MVKEVKSGGWGDGHIYRPVLMLECSTTPNWLQYWDKAGIAWCGDYRSIMGLLPIKQHLFPFSWKSSLFGDVARGRRAWMKSHDFNSKQSVQGTSVAFYLSRRKNKQYGKSLHAWLEEDSGDETSYPGMQRRILVSKHQAHEIVKTNLAHIP